MRNTKYQLSLIAMAFLSVGCAQPVKKTTTGAIAGTALGSGLGAIIGSATGRTGAGTAIGAGVGAVPGTLIGSMLDSSDERIQAAGERISATDRDIAENQRLLDELRSRGADARMTSRGVAINLPDILFGFNRSELSPEAESSVREISDVIQKDAPNRSVLVEGHTDSVGSDIYNRNLSERRADTVARALIRNGTDRRNVSSKGFGEAHPLASNDSASGRARNRRGEIVIER